MLQNFVLTSYCHQFMLKKNSREVLVVTNHANSYLYLAVFLIVILVFLIIKILVLLILLLIFHFSLLLNFLLSERLLLFCSKILLCLKKNCTVKSFFLLVCNYLSAPSDLIALYFYITTSSHECTMH